MMHEKGFTLMEILVALGLFSIISATMVPAFINHLKFNMSTEIRTGALSAAQIIFDDLFCQTARSGKSRSLQNSNIYFAKAQPRET